MSGFYSKKVRELGSQVPDFLHVCILYGSTIAFTNMTDYLLKYMSFLTTSEMAYVHQTRKKVIFVREQDLDLEMFWQFI